jgi:hypothetical protein
MLIGVCMKLSIEKIRNYNSVIQFIILILICVFILVQGTIYIFNQFHRENNSGVQIITKDSKVEVKKVIKFNTVLRDTFVFSLESNAISDSDVMALQKSGLSYERSPGGKEIVNFYFVSENKKLETQLFDKNVYIASWQFINDTKSNGFLIDKNFYAVVSQDTNEDNKLTIDDTVDLYTSDYNGFNLKKIGSNIYKYQAINDNIFIFSEIIDNKEIYKTWNAKNNKIEVIKTIDEIPENKEINQIYY